VGKALWSTTSACASLCCQTLAQNLELSKTQTKKPEKFDIFTNLV
jgi:hypothetical protein